MKKVWVEPIIEVQEFVPNEYVAACGDSGKVYKFKCDAGNSRKDYRVYLNGPDGKSHTDDDIIWSERNGYLQAYHPCGTPHEAKSDSGFEAGYMYEIDKWTWNRPNTGEPINVIVWTENGKNTHCTLNLNMDSWETAKS